MAPIIVGFIGCGHVVMSCEFIQNRFAIYCKSTIRYRVALLSLFFELEAEKGIKTKILMHLFTECQNVLLSLLEDEIPVPNTYLNFSDFI